MNVKANKAALVAALEAKRAAVLAKHKAELKEYPREFQAYKQKVQKLAKEFLIQVNAAASVEALTNGLSYGSRLEMPTAPAKPQERPNTLKYDRALAQLALVTDETVSLSEKSDGDFLSLI